VAVDDDETVAQALRKYPQYQNIEWRGLPLGTSQYHALEAVLEQHLAHGLQYRVGYTYSRLNNNGAESGMVSATRSRPAPAQTE
jgi:hypothetical protein